MQRLDIGARESRRPFSIVSLAIIALLAAPSLTREQCFGQVSQVVRHGPKVLKAGLAVAGSVSAAKMSEEAGVSLQDYWSDTLEPGLSVYSIAYEFSPGKGSWADVFSKPDVFVVVEAEGGDRLLIPHVEYNWDYSRKVCTFRCPTLPEESNCVIRFYDADSESNKFWNTVLSNRVEWSVSPQAQLSANANHPVLPISGTAALQLESSFGGTLQVANGPLMLNAPDPVAVATFTTPPMPATTAWTLKGNLMAGTAKKGEVAFKHWYTNQTPSWVSYALRPKVLFWGVLCVSVAISFIWMVKSKSGVAVTAKPVNAERES